MQVSVISLPAQIGGWSGRMETGMKKRGRKKQKLQGRLLAVLGISVLLLVCLIADCQKKGMLFRKENPSDGEQQKVLQKKGIDQREKRDEEKIRVLLTNSDMTSIFHQEIKITGSRDFVVEQKGKKKTYHAGRTVCFSGKDMEKNKGKILLSCPGGKLQVSSILRRQQIPAYRGTLELVGKSQGILLINQLKLKEYLYGVVPSEMSSSYPMEALKAQAVCARSFAWQQKKAGTYKKYGADVDDTTAFQVYNMAGEDKNSRKAVESTAGEMLFHGKNVITTYYYSTSWGCSATTKQVWGGENDECYPDKLQITEASRKKTNINELNLADEKIFHAFMTKKICDTYDEDCSWYRWKVKLSAKRLGEKLGLGNVKKIQILKREKSGILAKICIVGTKGKEIVSGQQNIREKLILMGSVIEKQDGSTGQLSMLPSAAFLIQDGVKQGKVYFQLTGGGFGHGVGMSQNGAAEMAESGYDYEQILMHYYSGCKMK